MKYKNIISNCAIETCIHYTNKENTYSLNILQTSQSCLPLLFRQPKYFLTALFVMRVLFIHLIVPELHKNVYGIQSEDGNCILRKAEC